MARDVFDVELGFAISTENGDRLAYQLSGTAVPDGTSGKQSEAPIGSLYQRSGTGELYVKTANAGAPADWEQVTIGGVALDELSWRNEKVRFATNDTIVAGSVNITTLTDNDDMVYGDIAVGEFVIGDLDGSPALFEVTATPGSPNITVAAASQPIASNDTFVVQQYLPDPTGQENQAIVHIPVAGSAGVKISDIDWNFADGISMASGYAAVNGSISSADTVNSAIEKLDGNQQDLQTLSGVAQGSTDLGTFTGATIADSSTVKSALQQLETAYEETDANVDDLITLSGVAENSTDLGTFTGATIADSSTIKSALQQLETAYEETDANVDDLITLSGVAENSTNLGAFAAPGSFLLGATETVKSALQKLADYLFGVKVTQTTGVTTATAVDSLAHATYRRVVWHVEVFETATPANREGFTIEALTDGTSVDDTKYAKLQLGAKITGLTSTVAINGANLELQIAATPSCTVNVRRLTVV